MTNKIRNFSKNKFLKSIINYVLHSPLFDYNQWKLNKFISKEAKSITPNQSILDVGAGELQYKKFFNHCTYVSCDLCVGDAAWDYSQIDIKASAYEIPVDNNSFHNIMCIQVLEHLDNPDKAFMEFNRILKPDGKLIISAPLGFEEHQIPYDFFRFTKFGLKKIGERHNFKLLSISPSGGIFINLEYILWKSIRSIIPFNNNTFVKYFLFIALKPFKLITGIIFNFLDLLDRRKNYTMNYQCVYKKMS